jgi:hypothetical protein
MHDSITYDLSLGKIATKQEVLRMLRAAATRLHGSPAKCYCRELELHTELHQGNIACRYAFKEVGFYKQAR